ncbi:MAG: hypothetical protein IJ646_02115 [Clostridia bacterium]|nr:hypothetical protein [Clostridia bacterium]
MSMTAADLNRGDALDDFYQPLTEAQLIERVDTALEHVRNGQKNDSEIMEADLIAELGI